MLANLKRVWSRIVWESRKMKGFVPQMGPEQISRRGHRNYVGGKWDTIGELQFDFLKGQGLRPNHVLYDIGCGALRAGVHFIPYLDAGNYFGMDREQALLDAGIEMELPRDIYERKRPVLIASSEFEFERFSKPAHYCIAQSLFTHLTLKDIEYCLANLLKHSASTCLFFATYDEEGVTPKTESRAKLPNPPWSHSNLTFYYSPSDMKRCAESTGWAFQYIGDWGHPAGQQMLLFRKN